MSQQSFITPLQRRNSFNRSCGSFRRMVNPSTTSTTTSYNAKPGNITKHITADVTRFDGWTCQLSCKPLNITHRTLEPVRILSTHFPDRRTRHCTTPYTAKNTTPVSVLGRMYYFWQDVGWIQQWWLRISRWFVPRTWKLAFVPRSNCISSMIFNYRSTCNIILKSLLISK